MVRRDKGVVVWRRRQWTGQIDRCHRRRRERRARARGDRSGLGSSRLGAAMGDLGAEVLPAVMALLGWAY
ncbi:hypothetical protein M0R45_019169 [Rubus argutus]|uniref:Uncharacterized protein n=1 Tax=Rubus argutus TaxID=59490 RepID=A0AAW1X697_RUBAR